MIRNERVSVMKRLTRAYTVVKQWLVSRCRDLPLRNRKQTILNMLSGTAVKYRIVSAYWSGIRFYNSIRRLSGRREVIPWLLAWLLCGALGISILLPPMFMKLIISLICLMALILLTFRYPFAGLMSWILCSPLLNVLVSRVKLVESIPALSPDRFFVAMLILVTIISYKRQDRSMPSTRWLHASMLLFLLVMLVRCIPSDDPRYTLFNILEHYGYPFLAYAFARYWVDSEKRMQIAVTGLIILATYFAIIAVPEHFLGRTLFTFSTWGVKELDTVRVQGPARSPHELSFVCLLGAMLAFVRLVHEKRISAWLLYSIVLGITGAGVLFAMTRAWYIATALAACALLIADKKIKRVVVALIILAAVLLIPTWRTISHSPIYKHRIVQSSPVQSRKILRQTAWNIIRHNPVVGVGVNNYNVAKHSYFTLGERPRLRHVKDLASPHNSYLRILVEGGIVAFTPLAVLLSLMLYYTMIMIKGASKRGLPARNYAVVFLGLSLGNIFAMYWADSIYAYRYLNTVWFFFFGALISHILPQLKTQAK